MKETKSSGECTHTCPGADFSLMVRMHLFHFDSKTSLQVELEWKCAPALTPVRETQAYYRFGAF